MDSIELPEGLGKFAGMLGGQAWPKEREGDFAAVSEVWDTTGRHIEELTADLGAVKNTVLTGLDGPTGDQFGAFIDNLAQALPQMGQGTAALSKLSMETALEIQYGKLMILEELVVTAVTIAELAASFFGAAAIPAVEAAAEVTVWSIVRRVITRLGIAAAAGAALGAGMDAAVQLFQHLKYGKPWNWKETVESAGLGALGGGLGAGMGMLATRYLGEKVANSFVTHVVEGGINGGVVSEVANLINGGGVNEGMGVAAGALGGGIGHLAHVVTGRKGGGGGGDLGDMHFTAPTFTGKIDADRGGSTDDRVIESGSLPTGPSSPGGGSGDARTSGSGQGGSRTNEPSLFSVDPADPGPQLTDAFAPQEPDFPGTQAIPFDAGAGAPSAVAGSSSGEVHDQGLSAPRAQSGGEDLLGAPTPSTPDSGFVDLATHEPASPVETVSSPQEGDVQGLPGFDSPTDRLPAQASDRVAAPEPPSISPVQRSVPTVSRPEQLAGSDPATASPVVPRVSAEDVPRSDSLSVGDSQVDVPAPPRPAAMLGDSQASYAEPEAAPAFLQHNLSARTFAGDIRGMRTGDADVEPEFPALTHTGPNQVTQPRGAAPPTGEPIGPRPATEAADIGQDQADGVRPAVVSADESASPRSTSASLPGHGGGGSSSSRFDQKPAPEPASRGASRSNSSRAGGPIAGRPPVEQRSARPTGTGHVNLAAAPLPDHATSQRPGRDSRPPRISVLNTTFVRDAGGRYFASDDHGELDLGDGRGPTRLPAGSEVMFDAVGEPRFIQVHGAPTSFDRFLDGGWSRRETPNELVTVKIGTPVSREPGQVVVRSEVVLDKGSPRDARLLAQALGSDNARLAADLALKGLDGARPVAIRNVVRDAAGKERMETFVPDGSGGSDGPDGLAGGWRKLDDSPSAASFEAGLAAANKALGAARSLYDIAGRSDLAGLGNDALRELLLSGTTADRSAAAYTIVARTGKPPRWTQVAGYEALSDGAVLNMAAGEGKSLVFMADTVKRAAEAGVDAVHVITTRDNLADREAVAYRELLEPLGYKVYRMNHTDPPPAAVKGELTVYVGTGEDVGFTYLHTKTLIGRPTAGTADAGGKAGDAAGKETGRLVVHANVDEIDEAVVYSNTTYILSEGPERAAEDPVVKSVAQAKSMLEQAPENLPGGESTRTRSGDLSDAGRRWVQERWGRELTSDDERRLNMAVLAKHVYKENVHYVVYDRGDGEGKKIYIIDQVTHQVMFNPKTSTQSRWNTGLAQAIEAEHGLTTRADSSISTTAKVTFKELLGGHYDKVVGASGTATGKSRLFADGGVSTDGQPVRIVDMPRYYHSQLGRQTDISPDSRVKVQRIVADAMREHRETGRPQVIIAHRNDLVADIAKELRSAGAEDVTEVDALWTLKQGTDLEAKFAEVVDSAGAKGKILVINMQGARGVDIGLTSEARNLGGLHVRVTAHSAVSDDIDVQAENRAARSGDPGSVTYYTSADDDIFDIPHDSADVGLAVIRYKDAYQARVAEHSPDASERAQENPGAATSHGAGPHVGTAAADAHGIPDVALDVRARADDGSPTRAALHEAEDGLRNLISPLQQAANVRRGMDVRAYEAHGPPASGVSSARSARAEQQPGATSLSRSPSGPASRTAPIHASVPQVRVREFDDASLGDVGGAWRKSTFSPVGPGAACVEAALVDTPLHIWRRGLHVAAGPGRQRRIRRAPAPMRKGLQ